MQFHDVAVAVLAFISELLGTLSGFGSSTFFVPAASFLEKFQLVLALTAILHCFGNLSKLFLFRRNFEWKTFLSLALPSLIFTGVGALLAGKIESTYLMKGLGAFLILWSALYFVRGKDQTRMPVWAAIGLSAVSGFSTGLLGTGGAIRGMALASLNIERHAFVMLSSAIDFFGDLLRAGIYLESGFMDWSQWYYLPLLGLAAILGTYLGRHLLGLIDQKKFEKIVALFVFIGGVALLIEV